MKISANELFDYGLQARDGEIGSVRDVFFDDSSYRARYLVAETGPWLFGRKVLISPTTAGMPDRSEQLVPVDLTQQQIKDSPDVSSDPPLDRDQEMRLNSYYDWPNYWDPGVDSWAHEQVVAPMMQHGEGSLTPDHPLPAEHREGVHLRSAKEIVGHALAKGTEEIGTVRDLIFDSDGWQLSYLAVEVKDAPEDKQVLLPVGLISKLAWPDDDVVVRIDRSDLMAAPAYSPEADAERLDELAGYFHDGQSEALAPRPGTGTSFE
jgi:hypothetical protein